LPADINLSVKKLAYDETTGKIIGVPFAPSELVYLPKELISIALESSLQGEKGESSAMDLQISALQDIRATTAHGIQTVDVSILKDMTPLPSQAEFCFEKFSKSGFLADLECAISMQKVVVKFTKTDHPKLQVY
jgi:hypothetical protein